MRFAPSRLLKTSEALLLAACLGLAGCGAHLPKRLPTSTYSLPDLPADLRACFARVTTLPPGEWDSVVVTEVITDLRKSEASKTDCGRRLIRFYDDARREAAGS